MSSKVYLCLLPFMKMHIEQTFHWIQDRDLQRLFLMRGEITWEGHQQYFTRLLGDSSQQLFAIVNAKSHIGNCGFKNIDVKGKNAELWVYIGAPPMRKQGFGLSATKLLLAYGFDKMGLEMIYLHVADFNIAARSMYSKLNFVEMLATEEWSHHDCNIIRMELKKSSWI